ncbi:MAG: hypothetical protein ACLRMZ_03140 [Blautia marasmi]
MKGWGIKFPTFQNGHYEEDLGERDIAWWTTGFWILWQMYHATGKEIYRRKAENVEKRLDRSMEEYEGLYHDVGFMWMHTAVADYCPQAVMSPISEASTQPICWQADLMCWETSYEPGMTIRQDG